MAQRYSGRIKIKIGSMNDYRYTTQQVLNWAELGEGRRVGTALRTDGGRLRAAAVAAPSWTVPTEHIGTSREQSGRRVLS